MSDEKNQVDPNTDENEIVEDEEIVHDAFVDHKVTAEEVGKIERIEGLKQEADRISLDRGIEGMKAEKETLTEEEIEIPQVEEPQKDEVPQASTQSLEQNETTQEIKQEISAEPFKEPIVEIKKEIGL